MAVGGMGYVWGRKSSRAVGCSLVRGLGGGDRLLSGCLLAQNGSDGVEVDQGGGACCL